VLLKHRQTMDPAATDQSLPPGTRLEEFVIERVLGSGGFGITYLARDARLGRHVVIKENLPVQFCYRDPRSFTVAPRHSGSDDGDNFRWSLDNFAREAAMLAGFDHPGIVKVLRSFEAFGTAYFVMPFVEGITLDDLIKHRREKGRGFSEEELLGLLSRVLDALGHLHSRGIYHRDIKPGNILITTDGVPVLIDFGSARQLVSERSMTVIESPGYTPFEQLQSRGNVGPWSDLYALGGTLYKMITGQAPPKAMDRMPEDSYQSLAGKTGLLQSYQPALLAGIDRALRVQVAQRWQSAGEWRDSIRPIETRNSAADSSRRESRSEESASMASERTASGHEPQPKEGRRSQWVIGALAAVIVLAVISVLHWINNSEKSGADGLDASVESEQRDSGKGMSDAEMEELDNASLLRMAESGDACAQAIAGWDLLTGQMQGLTDEQILARRGEALKMLDLSSGQKHPLGLAARAYAEDFLERANSDDFTRSLYTEAVNVGFFENIETRGWIWKYLAGCGYLAGWGVPENLQMGFSMVREAAEKGLAEAQLTLGICYEDGSGTAQDFVEAAKWYRKAAELGNASAQDALGLCYSAGTGVEKDPVEAAKWYRKAAEQGRASAMVNLGLCYGDGTGVAKDPIQAAKWYRKAAEQGYPHAQNLLGLSYHDESGVLKDPIEAVKWYRKAADQGHATAQANLGFCYEIGAGLAKDPAEAVRWYRKAAEQGEPSAQDRLGLAYANGSGVGQDSAEAVKWVRKAADQDYAPALNRLGYNYESGFGVEKDPIEAAKWYRKAAEQGDSEGQTNLGLCYETGTGVTKDLVEAVRWYQTAANQGDPRAQGELGRCFYEGVGVEENVTSAYFWMLLASFSGDEQAKKNLEVIKESMTGLQVAEALKLAREWEAARE
jgi:TPR repeat protein/serine/threonine protein kinase